MGAYLQSSAQEAKPRKSRGTNSVSSFALVGLVGLASAAVAVYRRRDAILDRLGLFPGRAKGSGKSGGASINKAGAVKASKSGATPSSSVKSKSGGVQSMDSSSLPRNKVANNKKNKARKKGAFPWRLCIVSCERVIDGFQVCDRKRDIAHKSWDVTFLWTIDPSLIIKSKSTMCDVGLC